MKRKKWFMMFIEPETNPIEQQGAGDNSEANNTELESLKKEIHTLKSQLGNANKELTSLKNKHLSAEDLLKQKETEMEEQQKTFKEEQDKFKLKTLEFEKAIALSKSELNEKYHEFITVTIEDTKETIQSKIEAVLKIQESIKNEILEDYNVSKVGKVGLPDKDKVTDLAEELYSMNN